MKQTYILYILFMAIVFFIAFLLIGNSVTKTWIQSFDNAGIILGYLWTCLTMAIAVYAFIRRQRIEQWWFRRAQFSGTGEELVNIAKQVDAIVIPVSMHPTQPKWIINCMKPTDVAFLYTDKTKDIALRIVNDFKGTNIKFIPTKEEIEAKEHIINNPDDPLESKEKARMFIRMFKAKGIQTNKIFVDTTGGKVPMSIGAFQAAEEEGVSSIYIVGGYEDPDKGMIIKDSANCSHGRPIFISDKTTNLGESK